MKRNEDEKRSWILVAVFLLAGLLCLILTGNLAIRFAPSWSLNADMRSRLNPDSIYLTSRPGYAFQPLDSSILTPPIWIGVFLTPGQSYPTRVPKATATLLKAVLLTPADTAAPPTATPTNTFPVYFTPTQDANPIVTRTPKPATFTPVPASTYPAATATWASPTPTPTPTATPTMTPSNMPVPQTDLQITIDDGVTVYSAGSTLIYTVLVKNNGLSTVNGAVVTSSLPAAITSAIWQCMAEAGAVCTPYGTGNIYDSVSLPPGFTITYQITSNISPYAAGTLNSAVSIAVPPGFIEITPGDNSSQDLDAPESGEPGIGPPNGTWTSVPPGKPLIMLMSQPILADGDAGVPDFVYYERLYNPTKVDLDWVQVEISADGNTWYQVFYWGDPGGVPDTNTNVDVQNLIGDLCPTEIDNCGIPPDRLYNSTGITIDVDPLVPPGNYPWIRITSPLGSYSAEVDAIQPYYP